MGKMIKIKELIGSEIRSRIPITTIKSQMVESIPYIIDMEGVTFISRSFTDELYNLTQDYNNVHFLHKEENVQKMMDIVWKGRKKKRTRNTESVVMKNFTSIDEFSKFLQTI